MRALVLLVLVGCYEAPPPKVPRVEPATVAPGAPIEIDAATSTERRNVTDRDRVCVGSDCSTVSVTSKQNVRVRHAEASYNGAKLTYGQVATLADPSFTVDWERMTKLSAHCEHATGARTVAGYLSLAGILGIVLGAGTTDGSIKEPYFAVGVGAMAGAIAAYALGKYALGGQDCEEARDLYTKRRDQWRNAGETYVEGSEAFDMEKLVETYNAKQHPEQAEPPAEPQATR